MAETITAIVLLILLAIDVVYHSSSVSKSSAILHHHHQWKHGKIQENESKNKDSCCPVVADYNAAKEIELPELSQPGAVSNDQQPSEELEEEKTFKKASMLIKSHLRSTLWWKIR